MPPFHHSLRLRLSLVVCRSALATTRLTNRCSRLSMVENCLLEAREISRLWMNTQSGVRIMSQRFFLPFDSRTRTWSWRKRLGCSTPTSKRDYHDASHIYTHAHTHTYIYKHCQCASQEFQETEPNPQQRQGEWSTEAKKQTETELLKMKTH